MRLRGTESSALLEATALLPLEASALFDVAGSQAPTAPRRPPRLQSSAEDWTAEGAMRLPLPLGSAAERLVREQALLDLSVCRRVHP
mmetsp:Transcript_23656/g.79837  ORF Transcript_23656/g.79837 Transcript_23656/m.79837 type:complete len:87 (+) Transcript_23656:559-819(+)